MNTPESLTAEQIRALRTRAEAVGDTEMVQECNAALIAPSKSAPSRWHCARALNGWRLLERS